MQEKEQLLKELRNAGSAVHAEVVSCRIRQLEHDLQQHAVDYNSEQFDADRSYIQYTVDSMGDMQLCML